MNKIIFHSDRVYNYFKKEYAPAPSGKFIPDWFLNASKYHEDKKTRQKSPSFVEGQSALGFKSCPALMDGYTSGYVLLTPCDIEFKDIEGKKTVILPEGFKEFCGQRNAMADFYVPEGYDENHFHWWPNWSFETPEGYSLLVIPPMNHFNLPFVTTSGIIDSDQWSNTGFFPFFVLKNFEGVIKAGTPFVQVIPFKREDWESEYIYHDNNDILKRREKNNELRFATGGGVYKKKYRRKKIYR